MVNQPRLIHSELLEKLALLSLFFKFSECFEAGGEAFERPLGIFLFLREKN